MAVSSWRTTILPPDRVVDCSHPLVEPPLDGPDDLVERQAAGDVLLGGVAHLGVHDVVGGEVLHALARDPGQGVGLLHHRDGVVEGLEVALQRARVGRLGEPAAQRLGALRRQLVPDLVGELDDRRRTQTAVEVVVQQRLGRAGDLLGRGGGPGGGGRRRGWGRWHAADPPRTPTKRSVRFLGCAPSPPSRRSPAAVGEELGTTDWLTIDQERVNAFADATDDHQWIHVDLERAAAGPFGGTIAHGYLTLSLLPLFGTQVLRLETPGRQAQLRPQQGPLPRARPRRLARPRPRQASPTWPTYPPASRSPSAGPSRSRTPPSPPASPRRSSCCWAATERGSLSPPGRAAPASARTPTRRRRRTRPRARRVRGRSARARRSAG